MNPFKYGCSVKGDFFCPRSMPESEEIVYWFEGEYRFVNPFFREWIKRNV